MCDVRCLLFGDCWILCVFAGCRVLSAVCCVLLDGCAWFVDCCVRCLFVCCVCCVWCAWYNRCVCCVYCVWYVCCVCCVRNVFVCYV